MPKRASVNVAMPLEFTLFTLQPTELEGTEGAGYPAALPASLRR